MIFAYLYIPDGAACVPLEDDPLELIADILAFFDASVALMGPFVALALGARQRAAKRRSETCLIAAPVLSRQKILWVHAISSRMRTIEPMASFRHPNSWRVTQPLSSRK
jgi:hypothetical protein